MLKARCSRLPCRNAYVTSCHGANDAPMLVADVASGHSASGTISCGTRLCSRNIATLATINAVVMGGIGPFVGAKRPSAARTAGKWGLAPAPARHWHRILRLSQPPAALG